MSTDQIRRPKPLLQGDQFEVNLGNIQKIDKINPTLIQQIKNLPLPNLQLAQNQDGYLVGNAWSVETQEWIPLCSHTDPWGEAETDASNMWKPEIRVFTILGFGLGYLAASLARRLLPHQRLAIFEPRVQNYAAALRAVDVSDILGLSKKRVDTFLGDGLSESMRRYCLSFEAAEKFGIAPPILCGFATKCDVEAYQELVVVASEMYRYHLVGMETWRQFGPLIGDNDLGNLPEFCAFPGLNEIKNCWKGKPAVCVAAGPSLRKNLWLLTYPEIRNRVAVLTVGTTYALLQALGIRPDVVTTIDFQELNWSDQFKDVPLDDAAPLVYLHSTWPETVRRWPGAKFVALNGSDTVNWMQQYAETKPHAAQVQTVAHLNLVLAHLMGADPIILIGQDLSMPMDEHHAPGARVQDASPKEHPDAHMEVPDYRGNPVYSRHSFMSMKTVFEQIISQCEGSTVINCTEGGLALNGAENKPLHEILDAFPSQDTCLRSMIEEAYRGYKPQTRWHDLLNSLEKLASEVKEVAGAAINILEIDAKLKETISSEDVTEQEQNLLSMGDIFGKYPVAFGQFAVRSFGIMEALSRIPPYGENGAEPDVKQVEDHNRSRLVSTSEKIIANQKTVLDIIELTSKRLSDLISAYCQVYNGENAEYTFECLEEMMERKSIHAVEKLLQKVGIISDPKWVSLQAQLFFEQQCYIKAMAIASLCSQNDLMRKCEESVIRHQDSMQAMRCVYYSGGGVQVKSKPSITETVFDIASAVINQQQSLNGAVHDTENGVEAPVGSRNEEQEE